MTNCVPIPQANQMTRNPIIPVQQPLLQHNLLVNPLRDIIGGIPQQTLTGRMSVHKEQRKQQEEEIQRRIEVYQEQERKHSGKKIGDYETSIYAFPPEIDSEHLSLPITEFEKEVGMPIRRTDARPTPKKMKV